MLYCSYTEWEEYSIMRKKNCQTTTVLNIAAPIGIARVASVSNWVLHESWSGSQKKIGIVLLSSQLSRWTCTETLATQTTLDNFLITPKNMGLHGYSFIHIKELSWQKRTEQTSCEIFKIFQYFFTLLVSTSFSPSWAFLLILQLVSLAAVLSIVTQRSSPQRLQKERNVVWMWAAVCGEERCMMTLKTAVRETILQQAGEQKLATP